MSRSKGFKDHGDRVIVVSILAFSAHGVVDQNNGWGRVEVTLDDGRGLTLMEGRDLLYEDEILPKTPVMDTGII